MAKSDDKYGMDGISAIDCSNTEAGMKGTFPTGKGDVGMDGICVTETSSGMRYDGDEAFPRGPIVEMDAVTEISPGARGTELNRNYRYGANQVDWPSGQPKD